MEPILVTGVGGGVGGVRNKVAERLLDIWKSKELPAWNLPAHVAAHLGTMAALHHDNRYDRWTDDVRKITGHPATSVRDWVYSHRKDFESIRR